MRGRKTKKVKAADRGEMPLIDVLVYVRRNRRWFALSLSKYPISERLRRKRQWGIRKSNVLGALWFFCTMCGNINTKLPHVQELRKSPHWENVRVIETSYADGFGY